MPMTGAVTSRRTPSKMPPSNTTPSSPVQAFQIHAFVSAHMAELVDLWVSAWAQAMPSIDFEARRGWFVDHLSALRDAGTDVWCAFDVSNGAMAGFITLDASSGLINQLAVAPAYWGHGAAQSLLAQALRAASGPLVLDVNEANARAVRFYEREGFRRVGEGINPNSGLKTLRYARDAQGRSRGCG